MNVLDPKIEVPRANTFEVDNVSASDSSMEQEATHWELHVLMLSNVSYTTVDNHTTSAEVLGPGGHQAPPARRIKTLGLLDVHYATYRIAIGKVTRRFGSDCVVGIYHLDRHSWPHDLG